MLQQTQVSRVIDYFHRFIARFPTIASLVAAPEHEVLALWSGLGYYRRARNLHAAARIIVSRFDGLVPRTVPELLELPGVGRYTAGSIASIAFHQPEPIVDGNVMRVLLRLRGRNLDPSAETTAVWAWKQAESLVQAAAPDDIAAFNEGLMELGATVCLPPPASPRCEACPLRDLCVARQKGVQGRIPRAKATRAPTAIQCAAIIITDPRGRILLEQRPPTGMWAGLWQCPTLERAGSAALARAEVEAFARLRGGVGPLQRAGAFTHKTTHRTVRFTVFRATAVACARKAAGRVWRAPDDLADLGMSNAAKRVIALVMAVSPREA